MSLRGSLAQSSKSKPEAPRSKSPSIQELPTWLLITLVGVVLIVLVILIVWVYKVPNPEYAPETACLNSPAAPVNFQLEYDADDRTATLTWQNGDSESSLSPAIGYSIYRKLNDMTVGRNNFDEVKYIQSAQETEYTFTDLPEGINWFVVTSRNSCGESVETLAADAASCSAIPPPAPVTVTSSNDSCMTPSTTPPYTGAVEIATINVADLGPEFSYIFYGDGWAYDSSTNSNSQYEQRKFFQLYEDWAVDLGTGVFRCDDIADVNAVALRNATFEAVSDSSSVTTTSGELWTFQFEPTQISEEYAWFVPVELYQSGEQDPYGMILLGGFIDGFKRSFSFEIPTDSQIVTVVIAGYSLCNKSEAVHVVYQTASS